MQEKLITLNLDSILGMNLHTHIKEKILWYIFELMQVVIAHLSL